MFYYFDLLHPRNKSVSLAKRENTVSWWKCVHLTGNFTRISERQIVMKPLPPTFSVSLVSVFASPLHLKEGHVSF